MPKPVILIDLSVEKRLYATHRNSIDSVTLKERVRAYKRYLLKHFDNDDIYMSADEVRYGSRRIVHERLDGIYEVERIAVRIWWKFWSRETTELIQVYFLELTYHPGSLR